MLRKKQVLERVPFSESTLFRRIQDGNFPSPYSLGDNNSRAVGWLEQDISDWIDNCPKVISGDYK